MKRKTIAGVAAVAVVIAAVSLVRRHEDSGRLRISDQRALRPPNSEPLVKRATNAPDEDRVRHADADRVGTLRLEGQVIDTHEHPVAEAEVTINTNPARTIRTEADGSFHVDGLVGRAYTLAARADAGFAGPVIARLTAASEPVILHLLPAASLEVRLISARDGAPVAGATVEARALTTIAATADRDGKAHLTSLGPGHYGLAAWAPGYAKTFQNIEVPSATTNGMLAARVQLRLQPGAAVEGHVLSQDGAPVARARVRFTALSAFASHADPVRESVTSDSGGPLPLRSDRRRYGPFPGGARSPRARQFSSHPARRSISARRYRDPLGTRRDARG